MRWKLGRSQTGGDVSTAGKAISQKAKSTISPGCVAACFAVFLLAGIGFSLFFVLPAIKVVRAQTWSATDCEVTRSYVESHSSDDGTTYSIEVRYRYTVDGVEYRGDRYQFLGGSSSGYDSKKEVVDELSEGTITTCWFDPADPSVSVMKRGFSWAYLIVLFPMVFVAIGAGGMFWAFTSGKKKIAKANARAGPSGKSPVSGDSLFGDPSFREIDEWSTPVVADGEVELEESMSPVGKFLVLVFITLFWNGIVSVFLWQAWQSWQDGVSFEAGCLTLFMLPFTLIGLALLVGVPYSLLAMANPRPKLTLSRAGVPLGGSAQLKWSFRGAASRLRGLKIQLEGTEHARYRRGTKTHTDKEVFATLDVVDRPEGMPLASGSATLRVPADTMHSFEGGNNKIVWTLKLQGEIGWWPDVITEFPFVVQPGTED